MQHYDQPPRPPAWKHLLEDPSERWNRRLQQARFAPPSGGIRLGTNLRTRTPIYTPTKTLATHMHLVGSTGLGKSFFLAGMVINLILQGHPVAVVEANGDLSEQVLAFCAYLDRVQPELKLSQRLIPFNVADTQNIIGFNPAARNARVMTYQVLALMEAIRKCWGQTSFQDTPRLARWLYNTNYAVVESGLTMLQARHLVNTVPSPQRSAIIRSIQDPDIRCEWEWIASLKVEKQEERLESCFNRLREFVGNECIRLMLGQYTRTLNFPSLLENDNILFANLSRQNTISQDNQHLLGTLIVNELLTAAFARPIGKRKPFFLFIDEFQHFVTKDMCEVLDAGRKYGLHLILSHQHLNQTKLKDPEVYYSVLANARTKVVMGGMIDEDLDIIGRELFELDPDEVKDEIWTETARQVETTRVIRTSNESNSYGEVTHQSLARAETFIPGSGLLSRRDHGQTITSTSGRSNPSGCVRGESFAEVPWYEYEYRPQLMSRTFRQLEEQLYIKKAQLKRQPTQHAALLIPGGNVQWLKTPTLKNFKELASEQQCEEFRLACIESAGCYKSPEQAKAEIQTLEERLLASGRETLNVTTESLPAPSAPQKPERKIEIPVWSRVPTHGQSIVASKPSQVKQLNSAQKRGPKAEAEKHANIARIVGSYGNDWATDDNLLEVCENLDKESVPIPKTWPTLRDHPVHSWLRALEYHRDLVKKAIRYSLQKAPTGAKS